MDELRLRKEKGQETQIHVVVRHLVRDAIGGIVQHAQFGQVPVGDPPQGGGVEVFQGGQALGFAAAGREGLEVLASVAQLAGAENLRMAGQDLLDQGGARARQAEDEHRPFAVQPPAIHALEQLRRERGHDPIHKPCVVVGVPALTPPRATGLVQSVRVTEAFAGPLVAAVGVVDLGQAEQEGGPFAVGEQRIGGELLHGLYVRPRQLAAQQGGQLGEGAGGAGSCRTARAGGAWRRTDR